MANYTFSSAGSLPSRFTHKGRYSMLSFGKTGAETIGTSIKVQLVTEDGGVHTIRTITDLATLTNNSLKLELPPNSTIDVTVAGSPTLYVQHSDLQG